MEHPNPAIGLNGLLPNQREEHVTGLGGLIGKFTENLNSLLETGFLE